MADGERCMVVLGLVLVVLTLACAAAAPAPVATPEPTPNIAQTVEALLPVLPHTPISMAHLTPGGGCIVFSSMRNDNWEVYMMDADGSNQTRLTNNRKTDTAPSWSPDGAKIAFTSRRDGNNEIYVMDADGSNQTRLTNNPAADELPAWSPDGARIAFTSSRDGNGEGYVMNSNGSRQTRLTNNPFTDEMISAWEGNLSWSPDGARIAFNSRRDGHQEIYVMNADGSSQARITNHPEKSNRDPSWPRTEPELPSRRFGMVSKKFMLSTPTAESRPASPTTPPAQTRRPPGPRTGPELPSCPIGTATKKFTS